VVCRIFRIVGDQLEGVEHDFEQSVLGSEFHPVRSATSRDDWVKAFRGRWLTHRRQLEAFLRSQESALKTDLQARADATKKRETEAAKESYRYRLKELQDRSREQELEKLVKQLIREQADLVQPKLFEEFEVEAKVRVQEIEEQMAVLRQDVERTRELLTRERDHRLNTVLPRRFQLREVRVLPLALTYIIPATKEDLQP
jgi:hypothetical protein